MQISPKRRDIIWNYAGTFLGIAGNLILLPVLVVHLNNDELGLWYVFLSIVSLSLLMQFGFGPTFARNVAYCWSGASRLTSTGRPNDPIDPKNLQIPDFIMLRQIITVSRIVFAAISAIALILISIFGTAYISRIAFTSASSEYILAWIFLCAGVFLNMYFAYFDAVLRGVGAVAEINKAIVISNLVKITTTVWLLVEGFGLLAPCLGYLLQAIIYRIVSGFLMHRYNNIGNELRSVRKTRTWKSLYSTLKVVSPNAFRDGVVSLSNFMATTANTIICSVFLSLQETGVYSMTLQFLNAASNVSVVIVTAYHPALQSAFANQDRTLEKKWISQGLASFYAMYWGAILGLILVVIPIMNILRESFNLDYTYFLAMALYMFFWKQQSICAAYIANTNRIPYMIPFFLSSVAGIVLSVILIKFFDLGFWGLVLGPAIIQLSYNNWKWPSIIARELNIGFLKLVTLGLKYWTFTLLKLIKFKKNSIE